jgi:hypothetical protein
VLAWIGGCGQRLKIYPPRVSLDRALKST